MANTGNGTTVTLASGFSGRIVSVSFGEQTYEMLDNSALDTEQWMEKVASDLADASDVTFVYRFRDNLPDFDGEQDTLTIDLPSGASASGTGVVSSRTLPELANGQLQEASFTFTFDGAPDGVGSAFDFNG
jgi:hypothetical protein